MYSFHYRNGTHGIKAYPSAVSDKNIPLALFYFIMILTINVAICGNVLYSQTAVNLFKTYILRNTWFVKGALIAGVLIIYAV